MILAILAHAFTIYLADRSFAVGLFIVTQYRCDRSPPAQRQIATVVAETLVNPSNLLNRDCSINNP